MVSNLVLRWTILSITSMHTIPQTCYTMANNLRDYIEMINEKWLTDVIFTTVSIRADLSNIKSKAGGDFQTAALSRAINTPENNEATFLAWKERAGDRKATLIFCVDVKHIHDLTNTFRRHGIESYFVTGESATKARSATLDAFKRGEYPVLLNCGVFTEGTDIPSVDCVVLARPTKSRNLLVQMIGKRRSAASWKRKLPRHRHGVILESRRGHDPYVVWSRS